MSLTESCLTIAVILTVLLTAVPNISKSQQHYELNASARQVVSHLRSTRIKAISLNRDCRIRVTSPISYLIECQDPVWRAVERSRIPHGLTMTANASPEFHPRGNVAPMATITITNSNGQQKEIVVNIAGRVRIK